MADAYLQSLLGDSETIRSEARQHPMALIRFAFQPILVFLGALVLLGIGMWLTPDGQGLFSDIVRWIDTLLGLLTAGMFILAIVWFPIQVFRWIQRRYMVTDRRVLYVDGVLRKSSVDAGLSMITDVGFRQGMLGRSLGYGDLVVATASNRPLHFRQIKEALAFKQAIMAAQHATVEARADEILVSKGLAPASAAAAGAPVAPVAPVVPEAPVVPPKPAWDGSDVPQMAEDDTPALDPLIFGESAAEVADEVPAVAAEVPVADEVSAAVTERVDEVAEAIGTVADDAGAVAAAASDTVGDAAEAVADTTGAVVDDDAEGAGTEAAGALEASEATGAPETAEAVETPEAAGTDASEAVEAVADGTRGHVSALDDVDSSLGTITDDAKGSGADSLTSAIARLAELRDAGAITAEEFDTRKQDLLDRL